MYIREHLNTPYDEYVSYLQNKYGLPAQPYYRWSDDNSTLIKGRVSRAKEGLQVHHVKEDTVSGLSKPETARLYDISYQSPENLCYCNVLEHFLLHIKIAEMDRNDKSDMDLCNAGINWLALIINTSLANPSKSWYSKKEFESIKKDFENSDVDYSDTGVNYNVNDLITNHKDDYALLVNRYCTSAIVRLKLDKTNEELGEQLCKYFCKDTEGGVHRVVELIRNAAKDTKLFSWNVGAYASLEKAFAAGNRTALIDICTGGAAQPLTSKIFTPEGYKLMGDIHVDDVVVSGSGKRTKITNISSQEVRDTYEIVFTDGTSIRVADNHLNPVRTLRSHKKQQRVLTTLQLLQHFNDPKTRIYVDIPLLDCWTDGTLPVDPYLLGCLIGDGSLHGNFGFCNVEPDIIEKVNQKLGLYGMCLKANSRKDYRIAYKEPAQCKYVFCYKNYSNLTPAELQEILVAEGYPKINKDSLRTMFTNDKSFWIKRLPELCEKVHVKENPNFKAWNEPDTLKQHLRNLELLCNSVDKYIPQDYLFSSIHNRLELLKGLMDTDGEKRGRNFSTSSSKLADDFELLTRSLGIQVTRKLHADICYTYNYKNINELRAAQDSYKFYLHPSNDLRIFTSAKITDTWIPVQNPPVRKISEIKYVGKEMCQCISVEDPSHTYLTDNLTITGDSALKVLD